MAPPSPLPSPPSPPDSRRKSLWILADGLPLNQSSRLCLFSCPADPDGGSGICRRSPHKAADLWMNRDVLRARQGMTTGPIRPRQRFGLQPRDAERGETSSPLFQRRLQIDKLLSDMTRAITLALPGWTQKRLMSRCAGRLWTWTRYPGVTLVFHLIHEDECVLTRAEGHILLFAIKTVRPIRQ